MDHGKAMTPFNKLTIGEIKQLTEEDVEKYSHEVGSEALEDIATLQMVTKGIGRKIIEHQIQKLKAVDSDLTGR